MEDNLWLFLAGLCPDLREVVGKWELDIWKWEMSRNTWNGMEKWGRHIIGNTCNGMQHVAPPRIKLMEVRLAWYRCSSIDLC